MCKSVSIAIWGVGWDGIKTLRGTLILSLFRTFYIAPSATPGTSWGSAYVERERCSILVIAVRTTRLLTLYEGKVSQNDDTETQTKTGSKIQILQISHPNLADILP